MCIIIIRGKKQQRAVNFCRLCSCLLAMVVVMLIHTDEEDSHLELSKV
jgi:hypothetical protein